MTQKMKQVWTATLETVNRGSVQFTVSEHGGKFYAHEIGEQFYGWSPERKAYRINNSRRHGNQHGYRWRVVPFKTVEEAIRACYAYAAVNLTHH